MQPQPVLVIFGQALRLEDAIAAGGGQSLQRLARERGADSVRGQEAAQDLPRGNVLGLVFGELIAVDAMDQLAERRRQRQHRHLHHPVLFAVPINFPQRVGVDQIFGVVRDHHVEADAVILLEKQHALIDPVEAVGLGGRSIVRAHGEMDVGEILFELADGIESRLVVRVRAHEKIVVAIADGTEVMPHHALDHLIFVPERDEDGDALLRA